MQIKSEDDFLLLNTPAMTYSSKLNELSVVKSDSVDNLERQFLSASYACDLVNKTIDVDQDDVINRYYLVMKNIKESKKDLIEHELKKAKMMLYYEEIKEQLTIPERKDKKASIETFLEKHESISKLHIEKIKVYLEEYACTLVEINSELEYLKETYADSRSEILKRMIVKPLLIMSSILIVYFILQNVS